MPGVYEGRIWSGMYDFAGVKRRPGAFSEKRCRTFWPPEAIQKTRGKTQALERTREQPWLMFRFATGYTVVAGLEIADGSRAKYDVGI